MKKIALMLAGLLLAQAHVHAGSMALAAGAGAGQPAAARSTMPSPGQYQVEGGTYMIGVEAEGSNLVTVEPNKRSVYTPQADGSFHVRNPANGILYGIRAAGEGVIEAFKPENPGAGVTRLVLIDSGAAASEPDEKWNRLAEKYQDRLASDPANTQTWVACAGVAMKRAVSSQAEADRYAIQMSTMLKQIAVNPQHNPCPEVFERNTW